VRRRVLLLVGATTSLVLIAFLVPLAVLVRGVATDRTVQVATARAQALSSVVATTEGEALRVSVDQADGMGPYPLSVFLPDGTRLGARADRTPLVELAARGNSASGEVPGGREIVFAVRDNAGEYRVIRTFVTNAELNVGVTRAWLLLALLGLTLLGVSLLVADRLARSLVRATITLAEVSHRLAGGDLSARADPNAPNEVGVVARALNHLAGRITELLREERETVADLAHRVRTPMTALRLEAEALSSPQEAARISASVEAVQRAVTQSIDQARQRGTGTGPDCDAAEVVRERVDFWAALAEDTDRELGRDLAPGPLPVAVGRSDLAAVVDALLGNVFAHTPDGTAFAVRLRPRTGPGGGVVLTVDDAGPGLPASGVVERGVSSAGSSGLGLDIARRTAQRTGGELYLERSPQGGFSARVELLAAP
jgi:signal transduction histidine kinase